MTPPDAAGHTRPTGRFNVATIPDPSPLDAGGARERILEAAVEVLAQRGYSAAGVQEIVSRSGTSKGSFYFHFPSKEGMVIALVDQMSGRLVAKVQESAGDEPSPLRRIAAGIDVLLDTFSRQRRVAQVVLLNVMGHGMAVDRKFLPIRDRFSVLIREELDAAVAAGEIEPQDTVLVARMWVGALQEIILHWLLTGEPEPLVRVAPDFRRALLRSVGARAAAEVTR